MGSLATFLSADHRECDQAFADLEAQARAGDWPRAAEAFARFDAAVRCHLAREEELLFPAFEAATGQAQGPTTVMRMEHDQMRGLIAELAQAIDARNGDRCLALCDTLMVLIQQHNMKEEQMLYPTCEGTIPAVGELLEQIMARRPETT